jgi:hypothetical protein
LQEAAAAAANAQQDDGDASPSPLSASQALSNPIQRLSLSGYTRKERSPFLEPALQPPSSIPAIPLPPSHYPIAADGLHQRLAYVNSFTSPTYDDFRVVGSVANNSSLDPVHSRDGNLQHHPSPVDSFNTYGIYNWTYKQHQTLHVPSPKVWPSLSHYYRPHSLDEIAPRETITLIIALFFDFV